VAYLRHRELSVIDDRRVHDVREMGLQREQAAGAGKQVNTTISARQDIMGAHGDTSEHHGEVQSDGGALRSVIWC